MNEQIKPLTKIEMRKLLTLLKEIEWDALLHYNLKQQERGFSEAYVKEMDNNTIIIEMKHGFKATNTEMAAFDVELFRCPRFQIQRGNKMHKLAKEISSTSIN